MTCDSRSRSRSRRIVPTLLLLLLLLLAAPARAETLTVGVFAPAAPFEGAAARVDTATKLASHLGKALGASGVGRVYGRAGDFSAAVKRGDVHVALVDATYLAAGGSGTVIAASTRNGESSRAWQLVGRGAGKSVLALRGKKLLVPSVGGRETDFALNALFGGELDRGFFGSIGASPDTASTLTALGLGKADAAVVPADAALPQGVNRIATLGSVPGPVLVVYGAISGERRAALARAAAAFRGDGVITGFRSEDGDIVRSLARRFSAQPRRGPMALPSVRIIVGDLLPERPLGITPGDPKRLIAPLDTPR